MTEEGLVAALAAALGAAARGPGVEVGIGDDAAVMRVPPGRLVATVDMVVEGQHFRLQGPSAATLGDAGWRALAVNLSDLAAMGARPLWVLSSVGVPDGMGAAALAALYGGMADLAGRHRVAVVGGNLARVSERLIVDVCALGVAERPLLRAGGRPGDLLAVTGPLGRSAAGRALAEADAAAGVSPSDRRALDAARLRPEPRVAAGIELAALPAGIVRAACDVSDGLCADTPHLCADGVGATIWRDALPVAEPVAAAARALGVTPWPWILAGGEDYELLLALDPGGVAAAAAAVRAAQCALHVVGVLADRQGLRIAEHRGAPARPLAAGGWDPFRTGRPGAGP